MFYSYPPSLCWSQTGLKLIWWVLKDASKDSFCANIRIKTVINKAVPSRKTWRRPLMDRQPYSVVVPSTGGRLHPLVPEGREAW